MWTERRALRPVRNKGRTQLTSPLRSPDSPQRQTGGGAEPEENFGCFWESSQLHVLLKTKTSLTAVPGVRPGSSKRRDAARKHAGAGKEAASDPGGYSLRVCGWVITLNNMAESGLTGRSAEPAFPRGKKTKRVLRTIYWSDKLIMGQIRPRLDVMNLRVKTVDVDLKCYPTAWAGRYRWNHLWHWLIHFLKYL